MSEEHGEYRPGVGIVLSKHDRMVFAGRRLFNRTSEAWQLPQGGIDAGEDIEQAMWRELWEETGVVKEDARIITSSDWLTYDIPQEFHRQLWKGRFVGQRQKWFLVEFTGDDSAVSLQNPGVPPEFDAWKWVPFAHIDAMAVYFKRALYREIQQAFNGIIDQIKA